MCRQKLKWLVAMLFAAVAMIAPAAWCGEAPVKPESVGSVAVPVGFEAMERLDLLPCFFPPGTQTRHLGNYDTRGSNSSGFRHWILGRERLQITVRCKVSDHPGLWKPPLSESLPNLNFNSKHQPARGINAFHIWVFALMPTTIEETPDPSEALRAEATGTDGVRLQWASYDDSVEFFVVERCGVDESAFTEVARVNAEQTSAAVSGLKGGALYEFCVQAHNRFGAGEPATVLAYTRMGDRGTNLLMRAKASASSVWESASGGSAAAAIDGKMDTRWNSAQGQTKDQWLAFKLAEPARLCAILVYQETGWTRIAGYRVQLQVDDAWKDVYQGQEMPDAALCRFAPTTATGVRIWIDETTGNTPTIKEVLAFTTGRGSEPLEKKNDNASGK